MPVRSPSVRYYRSGLKGGQYYAACREKNIEKPYNHGCFRDMDCLDEIAQFLFEKETITGEEFMDIYRRIKGIEKPLAYDPQA